MSKDEMAPEHGGSTSVSASDRVRRRLTVILASDIAGYSRLVAADEEGTVRRFAAIAERFREIVAGHEGRVFNTAGDAVLAEFTSAVDAVRCALDVHEATASLCKDLSLDRRLEFRIGIAVGDVIVASNGDLLGDGVNVAARLQTLAPAGGICVSEEVRSHVQAKVDLAFQDLGLRNLKNIPKPVRAFAASASVSTTALPAIRLPSRYVLIGGVIGSMLIAAATAYILHAHSRALPLHPFSSRSVPFVNDHTQQMLDEHYGQASLHKALSLSRGGLGFVVSQPSQEQAAAMALSQCSLKPGECDIYAIDDEVVWPRPLPMLPLEDVHTTGVASYRADSLPLPIPTEAKLFEDYASNLLPKALAVGSKGYIGRDFGQTSIEEAMRIARQRCADRNASPCQIYAINDQFTQPLPTLNRPIGYFVLAGESEIPTDARNRLATIYRGKDWRALVRGNGNNWFAVEDRKTETDAVTAGLAECEQLHPPCTLIAIGDYLIHQP